MKTRPRQDTDRTGNLMCIASTRSEIVPIKGANVVLGEIDMDSCGLVAFDPYTREILERAAALLASHLEDQRFEYP